MPRRFLFISPYAEQPTYGGAVARVNALARHLAREGDIWWARRPGPPLSDVAAIRVDASGGRWGQILDVGLVRRLLALGRRERFDTVVASTVLSALHGWIVARSLRRPFLFDDHNVEWALMRGMGQFAWPLMWLLERLACRGAARVTCVSEADRRALVRSFRLDDGRVDVVTNGVDMPSLSAGPVEDTRSVLFFGVLNYGPNVEALQSIDCEIAPRLPHVTFVVAGMGTPPRLRSSNVRVAGFVPDLGALLRTASVVIVPLIHGSGTRIKILEAVAAGRRVVSTSVGAEGLDRSVLGDALVVADGWDAFAAAVDVARLRGAIEVPADFADRYAWRSVFERCLRLP